MACYGRSNTISVRDENLMLWNYWDCLVEMFSLVVYYGNAHSLTYYYYTNHNAKNGSSPPKRCASWSGYNSLVVSQLVARVPRHNCVWRSIEQREGIHIAFNLSYVPLFKPPLLDDCMKTTAKLNAHDSVMASWAKDSMRAIM